MTIYKKPSNPTIVINGDVYTKQPDIDCIWVSFYVCAVKHRQVRVQWSKFYGCWFIEFADRVRHYHDLSVPIEVPDDSISLYLDEREGKFLDTILTETILKTTK